MVLGMSNHMSFIALHWVWVDLLCGLMRWLLMGHDPEGVASFWH